MAHDFELRLDFKPEDISAGNVLSALSTTAIALENLDRYFTRSLNGPTLQNFTLDRVEQGSVKLFVSSILQSVDDEQIRDKGLMAIWREGLVKLKHLVLRFLSEDGYTKEKLIADVNRVASEMSPGIDKKVADDFLPVVEAQVRRIAATSRDVEGSANILFVSEFEENHLAPSSDYEERLGEPDPTKELTTEVLESDWRLTIKKADLLGRSQWEFRLGRTPIYAPIRDAGWIQRFHSGDIQIRPGDVLDCRVQTTIYRENGTVIEERHEVIRVDQVSHLPQSEIQSILIE